MTVRCYLFQDIGQLLYNIDNETGPKSEVTQIIADIEQHFSKLCSIVQKHKQETIEIVTKVKSAEKESLLKAKTDVFNALKKANQISRMISSTADTTMFKQVWHKKNIIFESIRFGSFMVTLYNPPVSQ